MAMTKPCCSFDTDGFVAEGPGENVFLVKRGIIHEPGITSALDGITRRTIHCLAREAGYEIVSRRITRDELYIADEVFSAAQRRRSPRSWSSTGGASATAGRARSRGSCSRASSPA